MAQLYRCSHEQDLTFLCFTDTTLSEDTTALDTTDLSSDASPDLRSQLQQLPKVTGPTASALLGSHKPHDLSTIQVSLFYQIHSQCIIRLS